MQYMTKLDAINNRILHELTIDGRVSNAELAERVGLSASACLRRVQELERTGVIKGYRAVLDRAALGSGFTAYIAVGLSDHTKAFQKAFEEAFALSDDSRPRSRPEPKPPPVEAALNVVRDYGLSLQQPTLDPAFAVITVSQTFIFELFSGLVEMRWSDLELVPNIAKSCCR